MNIGSLPNRRTHDLRPEEAALRPLDDLLIHTLRRVVHDNRACLVIDLRIDPCIANEVDDPLFAFFGREAEAL